ncbi:MAG: glycosyltransferase family 2 protein [Chromatium okenii]|jgi:glycosyltransferase involved in cell wall biosynthesis|nr:glycosyltransferase family 2 protein [Chromatium okenii]
MDRISHSPLVTVIVPTLAELCRAAQIKRCIQSIRNSSDETLRIIVVVNGNRHDASVVRWFQEQDDIVLIQIPTPSSPNAVLEGRRHVTTPFFSTLDDDDEYLPCATDVKLAAILENDALDLVATNLYRHDGNVEERRYSQHQNRVQPDLRSLFSEGWLCSGNALYRSESIGIEFFENYHLYAEWTWLAFQLMLAGRKAVFLDVPTSRCYVTANSLSQSDAYHNAYFSLFERMLASAPPPDVARLIRKRISAAYHSESVRALQSGNRWSALQLHVKSLLQPNGLRYLLYTRRLIPGYPDGKQ